MSRKHKKVRYEQILNAAIELAIKIGYQNITATEIAIKVGVSYGLVTNYFRTMSILKKAVVQAAINREILEIIAQALALKEPLVMKINDGLKQKAINNLN